jgi:diguanylate cyclase (GGDEF)-like protein/PAS domain S-box-containing protein
MTRTALAQVAAGPGALSGWAPVIGALIEAVWVVEAKTLTIVATNTLGAEWLGMQPEELLGASVESLVSTPEDMLFWSGVSAGSEDSLYSDTLMRHKSGQTLWVTRRVTYLPDLSGMGGPGFWLVAWHDQTRQRQSDDEREVLVAELRATLESTTDGILVTDLSGRIRSFNQRFATLWDIPEDLLVDRNDEAVQAWMQRSVIDHDSYRLRLSVIQEAPLMQSSDVINLAGGRVLERVSLPQWSKGRPIGRVYSFRDLSERLAATQRIEELSHTDALTGLPNRRAMAERIDYAVAAARREASCFALLSINIDRFKQINDTLGHTFGDRVLVEVTARIKRCLRDVDSVARLGSDEFALLVHQADPQGAEVTARRVMDALAKPFCLDKLIFTVTASIGIALFPNDGTNTDEMLASADRAMHRAKESGRASFRFHQARKDVDLLSRMHLDHSMRQALKQGQFRLHYQPQVDLEYGRVIGVEALIRWHDGRREISPGEFIPVAEDSGFIVSIGEWVLREAVRQAAVWHERGTAMPMSVNVSALQFQQPRFVELVADVLQASGLPPAMLELELTESILVYDAQEAMQRLQRLADLGVRLAIDDFGTGYSSLSYLKRFPIHRLKIDRSFVMGLPDDGSDVGIANAIIQMGRALKLQVIAEGVETIAQREFLAQAGCHEFQGFLYSPALDVVSLEQRVFATRAKLRDSTRLLRQAAAS